jgi:hypothetical protein
MKKAKYKIIPSDVVVGNWHIYRRDGWWWIRLPQHWESFESAEQYIKNITGFSRYYDANGTEIRQE